MPLSEAEKEDADAFDKESVRAELANRAVRRAADHLEERLANDRRGNDGIYLQDVIARLSLRR